MDCITTPRVTHVKLAERDGLAAASTAALGSLHITAHHLIFRSEGASELWIPVPLLYSVTRAPPDLTGSAHPVILRTRDFKVYELTFSRGEEADGIWDSLKALCASVAQGGLEGLYAFFHADQRDRKGKGRAGWTFYNPETEFKRMGLGSRSKAWRVTRINADYEFCPTYPADIVVPSKISDSTLSYAVKYRSKGRIPGLVYLHWANLGSITRSSQPMVGMKLARSIQDEKLIEAIFHSHTQHSTLPPRHHFTLASSSSASLDSQSGQVVYGAQATNLIIDARPTTNAMANSVKGAGSENMDHYKNCKKAYLGIDNIHIMRASLTGIYDALRDSESTGHLDRTALRRTNWLKHLTNILEGILLITRTVHVYNSHVLVHCSDGWDRTSQLSSLAQLCLDPFYRTARGFAILVEKDWLSYGHRFADRTGHLCSDRTEFAQPTPEGLSAQQAFLGAVQRQFAGSSHGFKETSPVFHQFLDCVYQLQRQYPDRFEFTEAFLRKLHWELYATESGSFLFNSERDRARLRAKELTTSVWAAVMDDDGVLLPEFKNTLYDKELDDPESRALNADQGVLILDPQDVKWWFELFGRSEEEMNGRPEPEGPSTANLPEGGGEETTVVFVEDEDHDPLSGALQGVTIAPRSPSPAQARASSILPAAAAGVSLPSQVQIADAVSSVQKFGWGALKAVQKGYQEYRDATVAPPPLPLPSTSSAETGIAGGHSRMTNNEASHSGWVADDGAELSIPRPRAESSMSSWSQVSSPASSLPPTPTPSSPVKPRHTISAASLATKPRPPQTVESLPLPTPSRPPVVKPSPPPPLPVPVSASMNSWSPDPRRSSGLGGNPWDRPSSPLKSKLPALPPSFVPEPREKQAADPAVDVDPLGVGFA